MKRLLLSISAASLFSFAVLFTENQVKQEAKSRTSMYVTLGALGLAASSHMYITLIKKKVFNRDTSLENTIKNYSKKRFPFTINHMKQAYFIIPSSLTYALYKRYDCIKDPNNIKKYK